MRSSTLSLLLPVAVSASPIVNSNVVNNVFCKVNTIVISALAKDNAATAYCSSYLSIPTSTLSTTVTETPSSVTTTLSTTVTDVPITTTETEIATTTAMVTSTTTSTATVLTTVTSTTTSAITCLDSAFTYTAPTAVVPAVDGLARRGAAPTKPAAIPAFWASSYVSTACSCLSVPTPSVTNTITKTLVPGTISLTSTIVATPTITALETTTTTISSTVFATETATTTSTVTAYAVATTIASNGVQYRKYSHPFVDGNGVPFTSTYFKTATPDLSGSLQSLSFSTPNWPGADTSLRLADGTYLDRNQGAYGAILLQGFFIAKETGTYRFEALGNESDNVAFLWTGNNAYSAWNDANANYKSYYNGSPSMLISAVQMNAGDAIPLTYLWANTGGPGRSIFRFTTPRGASVTGGSGYFVKACSATTFA